MKAYKVVRWGMVPMLILGYVWEWLALGWKAGQQAASAHQFAIFVKPRVDALRKRAAEARAAQKPAQPEWVKKMISPEENDAAR